MRVTVFDMGRSIDWSRGLHEVNRRCRMQGRMDAEIHRMLTRPGVESRESSRTWRPTCWRVFSGGACVLRQLISYHGDGVMVRCGDQWAEMIDATRRDRSRGTSGRFLRLFLGLMLANPNLTLDRIDRIGIIGARIGGAAEGP